MLVEQFKVESPGVVYSEGSISSSYEYKHTEVERAADGSWTVKPVTTKYELETDTRVPKLGCAAAAAPPRAAAPLPSSAPGARGPRMRLGAAAPGGLPGRRPGQGWWGAAI